MVEARVTWRVFATCWLVYSAFWTPYIVREHFPAITLAERGSLNVEPYLGWTDDIFRAPRGGAYINNNPGASLAGAVPLVLLRPLLARVDRWNQARTVLQNKGNDRMFARTVTAGREFYFLLVAFLTVALMMAPATAGAAAFLCSSLTRAGVPAVSSAMAAMLCGLGTPLLFRTGYLNHNLLVADAGFASLLLLWDPAAETLSTVRAALAGLLAGFSLLCDYGGGVVIAVTALYAWMRSADHDGPERWRSRWAFAVGVVPAVAVLVMYQAWAFGSRIGPRSITCLPRR